MRIVVVYLVRVGVREERRVLLVPLPLAENSRVQLFSLGRTIHRFRLALVYICHNCCRRLRQPPVA